jgi:excisionase family DNA binding protein
MSETTTQHVYLTRREAADYLRIGVRTLDRLVAQRALIPAPISKGRLLFRRVDLDAHVEALIRQAARRG